MQNRTIIDVVRNVELVQILWTINSVFLRRGCMLYRQLSHTALITSLRCLGVIQNTKQTVR